MFMEKVKLENKPVNIVYSKDDPAKLQYANLLLLFYTTEIPRGLTFREMKAHLDFIQELEQSVDKEEIEIPKDMLALIHNKVEQFKWPTVHKDIIQFSEDVLNLK